MFGRTAGPWQHLAMYPVPGGRAPRGGRARGEHRRVRVHRASGYIGRHTALFERTVITEPVPLRSGETIYSRFGDWLAYLALGVSGASLALRAWRRAA
jgi:apolipoprotein N-acyltransferase